MEITGLFTALVIGLIIGGLGRLVGPGRQNIPILLTIPVGIIAAAIGTALAIAMGVATTPGIDGIELILQVALAAIGVSLAAAITNRRAGARPDLTAGGRSNLDGR
jgi:uncharacterized membrane protein YeaQ/YmgE (transglycosylase-associated protein family)